ncbi:MULTISPECIES: Xaa-Pro peptidase family protein [unclassified Neorhizobium]|uniref:M24 family metallopeptidase n=1 Tax=unclassified Neorhizobium TaxID=2629175 RepID=UPI001FF28932|nr:MULTISPECIES: Xaa-Pro peptidase family protein [unclassified Neorhizobium]MCJ9669402.1 Xaa-Pro peptidase family protein [Neorhizobium sp. SHOUNA12B]MCJ9745270.1 Xaa-Pro peptidase family protein [Neorhizobium sp. SHOUNA12A]
MIAQTRPNHPFQHGDVRFERMLDGFSPSFEFEPVGPLPESEFVDRLRRIRREATVAGHDVMLVHADSIGSYRVSNSYLRYMCDWAREGVLVVPTDEDKPLTLFSIFSSSVLLPPAGEAVLVEDIWQVGTWGRETYNRPGRTVDKVVEAVGSFLEREGFGSAQIGLIGDATSASYWNGLGKRLPKSSFVQASSIIDRMQKVRSKREQAVVRAAAQLASIGIEAAYHVVKPGVTDYEIYAAFTYAQMARGGESGDGYQIGINQYGTHCGKPYGHVVRSGDIINLYISAVIYQGYTAQIARMIAVGDITDKQEDVLQMCTEGVQKAAALIKPGAIISDLANASFEPYIARGYLSSHDSRTMPYNWVSEDDGKPRLIPRKHVVDEDWERQGRKLMHVYPATSGPHNPNVGHSVSMVKFNNYNIQSNNHDKLEEGMTFVLHSQWLEPEVAGCNVGDCYLVTDKGAENLSHHTPLAVHRVKADA